MSAQTPLWALWSRVCRRCWRVTRAGDGGLVGYYSCEEAELGIGPDYASVVRGGVPHLHAVVIFTGAPPPGDPRLLGIPEYGAIEPGGA